MEEWRKITVFPDYEVSNHGNVRSIKFEKIKTISLISTNKKYSRVSLFRNGRHQRSVHQLVCQAFIPNPENKPEIDHIDRNPANNMVSNLRWATRSENNRNKGSYSNTGEKYIYTHSAGFILNIISLRFSKTFKTLEDAVKFRDTNFNLS
jgi:hypothetical protein